MKAPREGEGEADPAMEDAGLFQLLFQSSPIPMWVLTTDASIVAANDAAVAHYGYSREELRSMTLPDLSPADDAADVLNEIGIVSGEPRGKQHAGSRRQRRKDGTSIDVEMYLSRLVFEGREAVLAVANDVTERQLAQDALWASEARMRAMLDTALDAVVGMDGAGRITSWNSRAEVIFGWSRKEALGRELAALVIPPRYRESHARGLAHFLATGESRVLNRRLELTALRRDGSEFPVDLSVAALKEDDSWAFSAFVADITERKRLEEQFRQAQKMEAVGRLAGGIAHGFNNLFTVILGNNALLLRRLDAADPLRRHLEEIQRAAESAASLTHQLLAFGRKQVVRPEPIDLGRLVTDLAGLLRRGIPEHIEIETVVHDGSTLIEADRSQIEQVIVNLAANAGEAMAGGGKLVFEVQPADRDDAFVRASKGSRAGPHVVLRVSDTGVGMDAETQSRIFDPFFTTKQMAPGSGLGLPTVYGIVEQAGGCIAVQSAPGQGSVFRVYLPRAEGGAVPALAAEREAPTPSGTETILLVEDDEAVRNLAQEILEQCGYSVLLAHSGTEAIRLAEDHQGPIHLLLTDVVMPGMSGPDVARSLRALRPETRILYMSGYGGEAMTQRGALYPDAAVVRKPFSVDGLAQSVRAVLTGDTPMPDSGPTMDR